LGLSDYSSDHYGHCGCHRCANSDGDSTGNADPTAGARSGCGSCVHSFGNVHWCRWRRLRRLLIAADTGLLATLHQNAVSRQITNLASTLDAYHLHHSVGVKYHNHFSADDAGNSD
jgi:hypothetical protein